MPKQLDLIAKLPLQIRLEERTEPRLWIRRLVVWSEPGVILQDISLGPGLNIVWSPDPADTDDAHVADEALGHGSGKTMFCRLLRYCLGEDRFAPEEQRSHIAHAFREGCVGAEIMIDGMLWSVIRPIGLGRKHFAILGKGVHEVDISTEATGLDPFLAAVETQILSDEITQLIPGDRKHYAWLIALAWLTRDQECRFDRVLDWRSADSDSDSPARSLSVSKTLDAVRALIGAINPEEHTLRDAVGQLEIENEELMRNAGHRSWEINQLHTRLAMKLEISKDALPPGKIGAGVLQSAATDNYSKLGNTDKASLFDDLISIRALCDQAQQRFSDLSNRLSQIDGRMPEMRRIISMIRAEMPGLSASKFTAQNPVCPICEVPIDKALAEGCKLSHKLPDAEFIQARWDSQQKELDAEVARLELSKNDKNKITSEINSAKQVLTALRDRLAEVERDRDIHADAKYKARRLIDDAGHLEDLYDAEDQAEEAAAILLNKIDSKREEISACRDSHAKTIARLSDLFDGFIREVVGPAAEGKVRLDGTGLRLSIDLGGERSTAAIDSLKIIAFDLAVLCMSMEGIAHVPPFLVHDSPREADLGLSVYHRLFRFVRSLEQLSDKPLFQYIITTTTRPPDDLRIEPWLKLTLHGSPAEKRLLRRDL